MYATTCSIPSLALHRYVQVAHFYNTIDQQMIPSQQPMLLEAALQFEHIIKHPKADADSKVHCVSLSHCVWYIHVPGYHTAQSAQVQQCT